MKLLFVDEFKESKETHEFYGLVVVLIDTSSYCRFKSGFYKKFKDLGWDEKIEIKGRYSFSSKGDDTISVKNRLKFVENLFELSKSGRDKYASAKVYYAFDLFPKKTKEEEMYNDLLLKILNKIPKGLVSGNKNGKNNIIMFLDSNEALNTINISKNVESVLKKRNLFLIERCIDFSSGNETPGIIFADYVAYFVSNYFKTNTFNEINKGRIKELLSKFDNDRISKKELEELFKFRNSVRKEQKSVELLKALKKMIYVK